MSRKLGVIEVEVEVGRGDLRTLLFAGVVLLVLYLPVFAQGIGSGLVIWVFSFLVIVPYLRLNYNFGVLVWGVGWATLFFVVAFI